MKLALTIVMMTLIGSAKAINFCGAKVCRYYEDGIINALSASSKCVDVSCFYQGVFNNVKFVYKHLVFALEEKHIKGHFRGEKSDGGWFYKVDIDINSPVWDISTYEGSSPMLPMTFDQPVLILILTSAAIGMAFTCFCTLICHCKCQKKRGSFNLKEVSKV